jgi:hypothetical protein
MTMTTSTPTLNEINALCTKLCNEEQTTIYFAVGCGLEYYAPGTHPRQQYPPFMAEFPGRHICILMDPLLESPPKAYADLAGTDVPETNNTVIGNVTFIPVRRNFEWGSEEARLFIDELCILCLDTPARLIVQDYAGNYIERYYPIDRLGTQITKKVLFDVTYRDGGCFIDLDAVRILRHRDGSFVQPKYDPISVIRPYVSAEQFRHVLKERRMEIATYVKRFHRIQTGAEEHRDWCTMEIVLQHMRTLCSIYHIQHSVSIRSLEELMVAYLFDLCAAVGDRVTEGSALEMIRSPTGEYENMMLVLEEILLENHHPV